MWSLKVCFARLKYGVMCASRPTRLLVFVGRDAHIAPQIKSRRRQPTPCLNSTLHTPPSTLHTFSSFCILQTFARFAILSLVKNLGEGTA